MFFYESLVNFVVKFNSFMQAFFYEKAHTFWCNYYNSLRKFCLGALALVKESASLAEAKAPLTLQLNTTIIA